MPRETLAVQSVTSSGTKTFSLTPPAGTSSGIKHLRIRFAESSTTPTFSGTSALKGEVEDYAINVLNASEACTIQLGQWTLIGRTLIDVKSATKGRIIGGNVKINSNMTASIDGATTGSQYSIASQTAFYNDGNVTVASGSLFYGTTISSVNGSLTFTGGGSAVNTNPPNFSTIFNSVVTGSNALAALTQNSTATLSGSTITFTVGAGIGNGVAVFNYNSAFGDNTRTLNLNGQTPSAIVINTTSNSLNAGGLPTGDWLTQKWLDRTIYNAPTATSGNFDKKIGSIIAPNASVDMIGAWIGSIAANNITINANNTEPRSLAVTCTNPVGLGNLVWVDANSNGSYESR